ncbi:unnamed protein product [Thlaspi arvense]|uniref:Protein FLUORESCENT IN BLUE LIGHT, chloroplastic n=1 Tax=Thlaspi arvense TaxID=13288 RepID=A0AAU9RZ06_THLAR|nr:unnamed protein product [Thlaspi arvense]
MAAIIRCCSSFSHTSGGRPPPREKSRGPVLLLDLPLLFSDMSKFATSIGCSVVRKPGDHHPLSKIKHLSAQPKDRECKEFLPTPFASVGTLDKLSDFEGIGRLKLPAMAVLLTNSLLMGTPLEALAAEICEPENSMFSMPVLSLVALVGATVGGSNVLFLQWLLARQRRGELQRLNEQLRQINAALRRQAKIESYAPGLSYAPVGARIAESASLQRQGKYREAIQYHSMVLAISKREGEDSGCTEAYGAIADCYTELGDLEKAGNFYDTYIARLETD